MLNQLVCRECAKMFFVLSKYNKVKTAGPAICHCCRRHSLDCRHVLFPRSTGFRTMGGIPLFEGDVLLNPCYGDFWTIKYEDKLDGYIMQLNGFTHYELLVQDTSFFLVARNKGIKRRRIAGLRYVKKTLQDPNGRNITFYEPVNLDVKLKEILQKVGYTVQLL